MTAGGPVRAAMGRQDRRRGGAASGPHGVQQRRTRLVRQVAARTGAQQQRDDCSVPSASGMGQGGPGGSGQVDRGSRREQGPRRSGVPGHQQRTGAPHYSVR